MDFPEQLKNSVTVAYEIIEQILIQSSELIYQNYINKKSKPYALSSILNIMISTVEVSYLRYDTKDSILWTEDPEPLPRAIDSWARNMIPVKKKLKMPQREAITFVQNDAKSMRSHSSRRSGFGKLGAKSQKVMKNSKDANTIQEAVLPIPISGHKTEAPEEEALRVRKELQIKKKKEENEKLKIIQKEEEDNLKKLQKDSDEIKNKSFTYDNKGKVILINPIHYDQIPPRYSVLSYNPEPLKKEDPKPVKKNKSRNEFVPIKRIKSTPNQEKDWVRNMTTVQVSLIDVIKLNLGVTFIDGIRTKYPTEEPQVSQTMSRKKYVSLYKTVEPVATLTDKKSESVSSAGSLKRSPESKKDLLQVIPDYDEFDNSENRELDRVNDLPLNDKDLHGKVMQYANGLDFSQATGPNEKFNAEILKNKQWGANPPLMEPKLIERLPKRPSSKELRELYGNILKKPKDDPFITPQELWNSKGPKIKKPRDRPHIERVVTKTRRPPPPYGHTMINSLPEIPGPYKSEKSLDKSLISK